MAERRMFAKSIIESDPFMDMPAEAQMLYIHLCMACDDDGFCDKPRSIMRQCGASQDSMRLLITKKFVLEFDKNDGFIVVMKHWRMNNYIRKDSYHETKYKEFMRELYYDENQSYSMNPGDGHVPCIPEAHPEPVPIPAQTCDEPVTDPAQIRDESLTQDRIGKDIDRIGKGRIGKEKQMREEDDGFVQFWDAYPKKTGDIRQAYQEYLFALDSVKADELLKAIRDQTAGSSDKDLQYFPSADKWLRNRAWRNKPKVGKQQRQFTPTQFD